MIAQGTTRAIWVQGWTERSLLELVDEGAHSRLRQHLNAFFTPENVNTVYMTLRDTVVDAAHGIAAASEPNNGVPAQDIGVRGSMQDGWVSVDGWRLSHLLILKIVMQVRSCQSGHPLALTYIMLCGPQRA